MVPNYDKPHPRGSKRLKKDRTKSEITKMRDMLLKFIVDHAKSGKYERVSSVDSDMVPLGTTRKRWLRWRGRIRSIRRICGLNRARIICLRSRGRISAKKLTEHVIERSETNYEGVLRYFVVIGIDG